MAIKARDKLALKRSRKGYEEQAKSNKLLELLSKVPDQMTFSSVYLLKHKKIKFEVVREILKEALTKKQ